MAAKDVGAVAGLMLFDTDVLIDVTRGGVPAYAFLKSLGPVRLMVPGAVAMEFLIGSRDKGELRRAQKALLAFDVVFADAADNRLALELVERHCLLSGLSFADFLIAAQALNRNATLYAFNLRHFGAVPGLDARAPYLR